MISCQRATCTAAIMLAATISISADVQAQETVRMYNGNTAYADYHVVEQGDTLYDLSGRYFGDTQEWPRLWSYNPHVTNPHWIYPGDIVYLRPLDKHQRGPLFQRDRPWRRQSGHLQGLRPAGSSSTHSRTRGRGQSLGQSGSNHGWANHFRHHAPRHSKRLGRPGVSS
jgi:hypothetical protein